MANLVHLDPNLLQVSGEYRVHLPDGRLQVVTYTADAERGFVPVVRYEGSLPGTTNQYQPPA